MFNSTHINFGNFFFDVTAVLLGLLLVVSAWTDINSRRIPNWLVLAGLVSGLLIQLLFSSGSVFMWGAGLLVGFALFLPLYLLKVMGAGDVKLMAMVGSFVGPAAVVGVVLMTLIAGGILAVAVAVWSGALRRTLTNTRFILLDTMIKTVHGGASQVTAPPVSAGNLPYAVAITAGTLIQLLLMHTGHTLLG